MSTSYFAHMAYGVVLDDKEWDRLATLWDSWLFDEREFTGNEPIEQFREFLEEDYPDLLPALREKYHAPANADLIHTGEEDDRPGACNIQAGLFILGVGPFAFPGKTKFSDEFKSAAGWHSWVEAS